MRVRVVQLALLLVVGGIHVAAASPASACDCAGWDATIVADADYVFEGRVVSTQRWLGTAAVTLAVSAVYKGEVAATQDVVGDSDGAACGLEVTAGHRYLVVGYREPGSVWSGGASMSSGLCSMHDLDDGQIELALGTPRPPPVGTTDSVDLYRMVKIGAVMLMLGVVGVWARRRRSAAARSSGCGVT